MLYIYYAYMQQYTQLKKIHYESVVCRQFTVSLLPESISSIYFNKKFHFFPWQLLPRKKKYSFFFFISFQKVRTEKIKTKCLQLKLIVNLSTVPSRFIFLSLLLAFVMKNAKELTVLLQVSTFHFFGFSGSFCFSSGFFFK